MSPIVDWLSDDKIEALFEAEGGGVYTMAENDVYTKKVLRTLKVSEPEWQRWKLAAAPLGVSAWLRQLANEAVKVKEFEKAGEEAAKREAIRAKMRPLTDEIQPDWKQKTTKRKRHF